MSRKNCRVDDDKLKLSEANEWEIWIETTTTTTTKNLKKKKDVQEIWRIGRKITGVEMKERIDEE